MTINLIYALSLDGFIGKDGGLPWHIPEDLNRFKELTMGGSVIMGRKTWDSLPAKVRPLPGRRNIVMTTGDIQQGDEGAYWSNDVDRALWFANDFHRTSPSNDNIWVIGGEQIFNLFRPLADYAYITIIHEFVKGDVRAPELTLRRWKDTFSETYVSADGTKCTNCILQRLEPDPENHLETTI